MRRLVRRLLVRGVTASILLPMIVAVAVGLGALLASLGDSAGATGCARIALVAGVGWLLAVATTAVTAGALAVGQEQRRGRRCRRRGRRGRWRRGRPTRRGGGVPPDRQRDSGLG